MDNRANLHENLFSRNATPPNQPQHPFSPNIGNNSSPNLIDSLFQNIGPPPPPAEQHTLHPDSHALETYDSSSVSALPLTDEPVSSQPVTGVNASAERQNALLSLLNAVPGAPPRAQIPPQPTQNQPQQVPTPPGSISQRSNASPQQSDPQKLLEQIMGGSTSRSTNYSDGQRSNPQVPSPPFSQRDDYRNFSHDQSNETSPRARVNNQPPSAQPPSPRRSMFEFTSPFDHLASSGSIKKKNLPPQPSNVSSGTEDSGWTNVIDPKRQSVENLLENLTRGPAQTQLPSQPPAYEAYLSNDFQQEQQPPRAPLPPIPASKPVAIPPIPDVSSSPRGGSPKHLHRPQPRAADVTTSQQVPFPGSATRREKDSSPGPRNKNGLQRVPQSSNKFTKPPVSPGPQSQTVIFDVSLPLDEIQARESVKSTAIALVRQDSVFLPGTTIGATHWVAYAMPRGRVRVISRSSGDRTLLQLPAVFTAGSSVIDMAVYGNRLAGVTSDGGFVVWELPDLITDDVPGRILLCVPPTTDQDAIRAVKWHPKDSETLAIASDNKIFVIDLANTHALHHGQPLPHSDLHHIGQQFNIPSVVVAFDFDVVHYALATISEDSSLTIWNMHDSLPYASHKIYGDDVPSSLTFVDGGIVVGRKNGTVFQLLSVTTKSVLSTIKFVNNGQEDSEMFGHVSYDSRIQTLWVANSRRDSLIAMKIHLEPGFAGSEEIVHGFVEQVAEFSGIKPTIHFVILTADADPHGAEAHAACVAAKIPPTDLALVAFSVHSTGVDQVLIRKEWFDMALLQAPSKFPFELLSPNVPVPAQSSETGKPIRQPLPPIPGGNALPPPPPHPIIAGSSFNAPLPRGRTPPSDDVENEFSEGRGEQKTKGNKGKNVNWKEKEEIGKEKDKAIKSNDNSIINESHLGQALSREIKKTEESLHSRIGRLIGKEMDKQHQRFEEARLHEQAEDFARQEKILKLISTELTRNTTRVVEQAVRNEVQQSVLPSLENVTREEVKIALHEQMGSGLIEVVNRGLPGEMEKVLLRPSISNHYGALISQTLMPVIERQVKDSLSAAFLQFHSQHSVALQQEIMRELRGELSVIKSDLANWHAEGVRNQEATIRDLERTVRALSEQVKFLTMNQQPPPLHHIQGQQATQNSPGGPPSLQSNIGQSHLRLVNMAPTNQSGAAAYPQPHSQYQPAPPQTVPLQQPWFNGIAAPQASHPATLPQAPQVPQERTPPPRPDQWDETYLSVLHSQDINRLKEILRRSDPEVVFPLNGPPLVSQAVILTLIHRLSVIVGDTPQNDEHFNRILWYLQRVTSLLRPDDKLISDFIPRVIPTVQQSLNTTKQRWAILPAGSGTIEAAQRLSEVQDALRRKVPL